MLARMTPPVRRDRNHFSCPVEVSLAILGGKWKTVILAHLKEGPLRYGELRARIPSLADKVLSQRLRDLEAQGLVSRRKSGRRGSPSTYELTPRGRSLGGVLQALYDWGTGAAPSLGVTIDAPQVDASVRPVRRPMARRRRESVRSAAAGRPRAAPGDGRGD
jgi:DNA-binding HxlR family transcriptional regulator